MKLIAHRGNINGPDLLNENNPEHIENIILQGYDVEIDLWWVDGRTYLGHDEPQYGVTQQWFNERYQRLWIHCKNVEAMEWFNMIGGFNYFWHQEDTLTLTSMNVIWAYPGKQPIKGSIAVMPELNNDDISEVAGVCSDFIKNYKK